MKRHSVFAGALALASLLAVAPQGVQAQVVYDSVDKIWYEAVYTGPVGTTWNDAASTAAAMGGFLAAPMNDSQNSFVYSLVTDPKYWTGLSDHADRLGPWLGVYSTTANTENFVYSGSGQALGSFHPWGPNQPDGYGGGVQAVDFYAFASEGSTWGDTPEGGVSGFPLPTGFVVQFNANPVPEASTVAMMLVGLGLLATVVWRNKLSPAKLS